jgi:hypothetical protein
MSQAAEYVAGRTQAKERELNLTANKLPKKKKIFLHLATFQSILSVYARALTNRPLNLICRRDKGRHLYCANNTGPPIILFSVRPHRVRHGAGG